MKILRKSTKVVEPRKRKDIVEPCECGCNRWKTEVKGKIYRCRNKKCLKIRVVG